MIRRCLNFLIVGAILIPTGFWAQEVFFNHFTVPKLASGVQSWMYRAVSKFQDQVAEGERESLIEEAQAIEDEYQETCYYLDRLESNGSDVRQLREAAVAYYEARKEALANRNDEFRRDSSKRLELERKLVVERGLARAREDYRSLNRELQLRNDVETVSPGIEYQAALSSVKGFIAAAEQGDVLTARQLATAELRSQITPAWLEEVRRSSQLCQAQELTIESGRGGDVVATDGVTEFATLEGFNGTFYVSQVR